LVAVFPRRRQRLQCGVSEGDGRGAAIEGQWIAIVGDAAAAGNRLVELVEFVGSEDYMKLIQR
jgi:uncharacterized Zn-binding protein involved in type VI secretion